MITLFGPLRETQHISPIKDCNQDVPINNVWESCRYHMKHASHWQMCNMFIKYVYGYLLTCVTSANTTYVIHVYSVRRAQGDIYPL